MNNIQVIMSATEKSLAQDKYDALMGHVAAKLSHARLDVLNGDFEEAKEKMAHNNHIDFSYDEYVWMSWGTVINKLQELKNIIDEQNA